MSGNKERTMARFISHLNAMALVLLCSFVSASEVPKSTTAVPNGSFPVVDFGKVKPGDVLTLQVDPPSDYEITSGSPSGGGASPWEGEMSSFSATITGDYRGLHSGSFSGELRYTGASQGNGGGGTPTITWAGDSTATIPDIQFTLQKVSFSGDGYHAIKPDDGGNAFEAPQWVAAEGNGIEIRNRCETPVKILSISLVLCN